MIFLIERRLHDNFKTSSAESSEINFEKGIDPYTAIDGSNPSATIDFFFLRTQSIGNKQI